MRNYQITQLLNYLAILILTFFSLCSLCSPTTSRQVGTGVAYGARSIFPVDALIRLHAEATVSKTSVFISDVASVTCEEEKKKKVEGIEIGRAPILGQKRIFSLASIKLRLRQHGINPDDFLFEGPSSIVVSTKSVKITPEEILQKVMDFIKNEEAIEDPPAATEAAQEASPPPSEGGVDKRGAGEIKVEPMGRISPIFLPYGKVAIEVSSSSQEFFSGRRNFLCRISVDDKVQKTLMLPFKIFFYNKEVAVAKRSIYKDEEIKEEDICMEKRDIEKIKDFFPEKTALLRKRAAKIITEGEIFTSQMVEDIPVVRRGDLVTVIVETPTLRIIAQGKALGEGRVGERISILNLNSKKVILAEVLQPLVVKVPYQKD